MVTNLDKKNKKDDEFTGVKASVKVKTPHNDEDEKTGGWI